MMAFTRWGKFVTAVLVVAVAGSGMWVSAGDGQPGGAVAPRPAPRQPPDTPEEFRRAYTLAPGEDLKRIPPSFPESRAAYYNGLMQPHGGDAYRADQIQSLLFRQDGPGLGVALATISGGDDLRGKKLDFLLAHLLEISSQDIEGNKQRLRTFVEGDFVVRKGVPKARLVERLGVILRDECKIPVRLSLREVDRDVVVAKGRYRVRPLKPGDESGNEPTIEIYGATRVENRKAGEGSGDFAAMLRAVGWFTYPNCRIVNEATDLPKGDVRWTLYERFPADERTTLEDHDKALVFEHLAGQTGLTFEAQERRLLTLIVDPADKAADRPPPP